MSRTQPSNERRSWKSTDSFALVLMLLLFAVFSSIRNVASPGQGWMTWLVYLLPYIGMLLALPRLRIARRSSQNDTPIIGRVTKKYLLPLTILWIVLMFFSLLLFLLNGKVIGRFFSEAVFMLSPLVAVFFTLLLVPRHGSINYLMLVRFLFIVVCLFFVLLRRDIRLENLAIIISNPQLIFTETTLGAAESLDAYIFGLLGLYFFAKKDYVFFSVALVFTVLSYKRIGLTALFVALIIYVLYKILHGERRKRPIILIALTANFLILYFIINLAVGGFDQTIRKLTGKAPNVFTAGRSVVYAYTLDHFNADDTAATFLFAGAGIGSITDFFRSTDAPLDTLLSDLLKMYVEVGTFGFILWIVIFYWVHSANGNVLMLAIFTNILWISDNTLIYFNYLFIFYFLCALFYIEDCQAKIDENPLHPQLLSTSRRGR